MTDEKENGHLAGLSQKPKSWDDFFGSPVCVTDDFMAEREQPKDQERKAGNDFMKERPELLDDDQRVTFVSAQLKSAIKDTLI